MENGINLFIMFIKIVFFNMKKIAIQMDKIENIDINFDSSFLICLEAQKRNYEIFYYNPEQLFYDEGINSSEWFLY